MEAAAAHRVNDRNTVTLEDATALSPSHCSGDATILAPSMWSAKAVMPVAGKKAHPFRHVSVNGTWCAFHRSEVDIDRLPRFAPAKHSQPADEAEAPLPRLALRLQVGRRANQGVHGRRSLANRRCCSISPEVGAGARGASW